MSSANPIEYDQIDHVVLRVRDAGVMLAFYRDVLGCDLVKHNESVGLYHLRAGSSMIDLMDVAGEPEPEGQNMDHVALRLNNFDAPAIQAWLRARDIEVSDAVMRFGAAGDALSLYLKDPEGNLLELKGQ